MKPEISEARGRHLELLYCLAGSGIIVFLGFKFGDSAIGRAFSAPSTFVYKYIGGPDLKRMSDVLLAIFGAVVIWASAIQLMSTINSRALRLIAGISQESMNQTSVQKTVATLWLLLSAIGLLGALFALEPNRVKGAFIICPVLAAFVLRSERLAAVLLSSFLVYSGLVSLIPWYIKSAVHPGEYAVSAIVHFGSATVLFVGSAIQPPPANDSIGRGVSQTRKEK